MLPPNPIKPISYIPQPQDINKSIEESTFLTISNILAKHKIKYFHKNNFSDKALLYAREASERYAYRSKNLPLDRFSKNIEVFPAIISDIFDQGFDLEILKTDTNVDILMGIDFFINLGDFVIGVDVTTNVTKTASVSIENMNSQKLIESGKSNQQEDADNARENFIKVLVYIDKKKFINDFNNLLENKNISFQQAYLILLKRYYFDQINRSLCLSLTGGKSGNFRLIKQDLAKGDIYKYFGTRVLNEISEEKKYILNVLLELESKFYLSDIVRKLEDIKDKVGLPARI